MKKLTLLFVLVSLVFVSCKKDETPQPTNSIPSLKTYLEGSRLIGTIAENHFANGTVSVYGNVVNDFILPPNLDGVFEFKYVFKNNPNDTILIDGELIGNNMLKTTYTPNNVIDTIVFKYDNCHGYCVITMPDTVEVWNYYHKE